MSQDILSQKTCDAIDVWVAKYPADQKQSAVMGALLVAQEHAGGSLTTEIMDAIAEYLSMPKIAVYEVATFYSMYEHKPVGKHKICVCTNVSCMLRGSDDIVEHLKNKLGIGFGQTSKDGRFTLKEVECLAACGGAPMMQIDKTYYENLTEDKVDAILERLSS